jgi:hypothetical protein
MMMFYIGGAQQAIDSGIKINGINKRRKIIHPKIIASRRRDDARKSEKATRIRA